MCNYMLFIETWLKIKDTERFKSKMRENIYKNTKLKKADITTLVSKIYLKIKNIVKHTVPNLMINWWYKSKYTRIL